MDPLSPSVRAAYASVRDGEVREGHVATPGVVRSPEDVYERSAARSLGERAASVFGSPTNSRRISHSPFRPNVRHVGRPTPLTQLAARSGAPPASAPAPSTSASLRSNTFPLSPSHNLGFSCAPLGLRNGLGIFLVNHERRAELSLFALILRNLGDW